MEAYMIGHAPILLFNSNPAALHYETDKYRLTDTFGFGFTIMEIAWLLNILIGKTWFKVLVIRPSGTPEPLLIEM